MQHQSESRPLPEQVQIVIQSLDDYLGDRWLWAREGMVVRNNGLVLRIYAAQITAAEPIIEITVVDLGPRRLVRIQALEETDGSPLRPYVPATILHSDLCDPDEDIDATARESGNG